MAAIHTHSVNAPFVRFHADLLRLARVAMKDERPGHLLEPTALVNEVFLRFTESRTCDWQSPSHFCGSAARAMRQVLVDHSRAVNARKRRESSSIRQVVNDLGVPPEPELVFAIHLALDRLAQQNRRAAHLVELRFFGGFSFEESAERLNISLKTAKRDWEIARRWLQAGMRNDLADEPCAGPKPD